DEMMAYALLGIMEETAMRLRFDDRYSTEDYLWANLEAYLPVRALYTGRMISDGEFAAYATVVTELASGPLFTF
ncbi:MAG: hypothetical protein M1274_14175, partial [Actinobacteria bacterium]|nr:hypothetical protein [Actinomycetota bacterium]